MSHHHHERMQFATAPAIEVADVERFDPTTGETAPFNASGWTLYFRMWKHGSTTLIVEDEAATQPEVGRLRYQPAAGDVDEAGDYRGVFWAQRTSDDARDFWPVQTIRIVPVIGGAPV